MPNTLVLYNTLTNRPEPFTPADPSRVTFYTCGPTVYDDAHIGNFRAFLGADLLRRFIESPLCRVTAADGSVHDPVRAGPRSVVHVMNITDVGHMTDDSAADGGGEDKMAVAGQRIAESKKQGKIPEDAQVDTGDPRAIAAFFAGRFREDAVRLGLKVAAEAEKDASLMPLASASVDGMRAVIGRLLENGSAYTAGEAGSRAVYFDVRTYEAYGELSGNTLEKLRGGAGGRVSEANQSAKRHPADFMLWKEDASHLMKWPAPESRETKGWDEGYPGWHIECTAMSLGKLIWTPKFIRNRLQYLSERLHSVSDDQPSDPCTARALREDIRGRLNEWFRVNTTIRARSPYLKSVLDVLATYLVYLLISRSRPGPCSRLPQLPVRNSVASCIRKNQFIIGLVLSSDDLLHRSRNNKDDELDLHSGGEDNIFPHHECERAQSCALTGGTTFARHWFHTRYLMVEGKKMSKSAGTFFTARDLFTQGHEPAAVRLELIKTHYRSNADFSMEGLRASAKTVDRLRRFLESCPEGEADPAAVAEHPVCAAFAASMHDDLNIAGALGEVNKWMGSVGSPTAEDGAAVRMIDGVLGLLDLERGASQETAIGVYTNGAEPSEAVEALLAERAGARKAKDFARADEIRDELASMGLSIKDAAGGKVEVGRL